MEASVAIVQLRQSALSDRIASSPHDYDVMILDELSRPSTSYAKENQPYVNSRTTVGSHAVGSTVIALPKFRITNDNLSLSDAVLENLGDKTKIRYRRAITVPLWDDRPSCSNTKSLPLPGTALVCAPALSKDKIQFPYGRLENLARLVNMCHNSPESLDVQTRHMLLRLEEWIAHSQCTNPHFLASLFVRPPACQRVVRCSHNPAYVGEEQEKCVRYIQRMGGSARSVCSSVDLDDKVRIGNLARVQMMTYNKCNTFVLNPLFGWMPYGEDQVPEYFASCKRQRTTSRSSQKSFEGRFPLHRAAYLGDHKAIETMLARGVAVNEMDKDSWTALHYACFYGHQKAVDVLLTIGSADVNVQNKGGATPLHFAAVNGNVYLVELMLSHAKIDKEIRNCDGRTALDLCENVPKPQWQAIANLLREWKKIDKTQVDFLDAGRVMVLLVDGEQTTVAQVIAQIIKEVKMSASAAKLFGLWVCSESAAVQLQDKHKIASHTNVKKWRQNVAKWTDREESDEVPRLVFRRNAHATVEMEERIQAKVAKHEFVISLLFDEARYNFLKGCYPCEEKQMILLATIGAKILYGPGSVLSENSDLSLLLPIHVLTKSTELRRKINKSLKESPPTSNIAHLQNEFLRICREFRVYGSTFFAAEVYLTRPHSQQRALCGVNDLGFHIISLPSHNLLGSYEYRGLNWELSKEQNYLTMRARSHDHQLTIRTPQAPHIAMLLNKMSEITKG